MTPQKPYFIFQPWLPHEGRSVLESAFTAMPRLLYVGKIKFRTFCVKPPTRFFGTRLYKANQILDMIEQH